MVEVDGLIQMNCNLLLCHKLKKCQLHIEYNLLLLCMTYLTIHAGLNQSVSIYLSFLYAKLQSLNYFFPHFFSFFLVLGMTLHILKMTTQNLKCLDV